MRALVFSTHRQIRDYIAAHDDTLLPKLYTMDEWIRRLVVVPGKIFVDKESRVLYLYRAIENLDISRLGFDKNFLEFVKNSEFVFRFFEELHAERVSIETLRVRDIYADYEEHLTLLEAIRANYADLLEAEGLTDRILVEDFRICEGCLEGLSRVDLFVDGYLSRFECEVLDRIGEKIHLHFAVNPFNRKLIERIAPEAPLATGARYTIAWRDRSIESSERMPAFDPSKIEVAAFGERIDQVGFVLKKVDDFIHAGAAPDRVAVILPDEGFADYLRLFDTFKNFNYAMGTPFTQTRYYRLLADIYEAVAEGSERALEKVADTEWYAAFEGVESFEEFLAFLDRLPASVRELKAMEEVKYGFATFTPWLKGASPLQWLHLWMRRLKDLSLDDIGGGKVTVMGVLESRGKDFDGVVLVDFNEEWVPRVGEKDLFLNSTLRQATGMPTRMDKENLQKNYYYALLQRSRMAAIAYVSDEENQPSRFLMELGLDEPSHIDERYRAILAPSRNDISLYDAPIVADNPFVHTTRLTPSRLKDFLECPRRYYYRYLLGIGKGRNDEKPTLGTLIHEALEASAKVKGTFKKPEDYFESVMDALYRRIEDPITRLDVALEWEERLERFCRDDYERLMGSEQIGLERWCETPYGTFTLASRVDRIDLTPSVVRMIDFKTTSDLQKTIKNENDFQLLFYALWAKRAYPDRKIETYYADLHKVQMRLVDALADIPAFDAILADLKTGESLDFAKTDEVKRCQYCEFKIACGRAS